MGIAADAPWSFLVRGPAGWRTSTFSIAPTTHQLLGWNAADWLAVPLHAAQLGADSFDVEYSTPTARTVSLSFDVIDNLEAPEPWADEALTLPQRHNWTSSIKDGNTFRVNSFDAGNLRRREVLYRKRTLSISILLTGRQAIAEFRRWLYAVRGRLNAFEWQAPQDVTSSTWRLASDEVELQYLKPSLVVCELALVEVAA